MAAAFRLPEMAKIVEILNPATDAAGRTGNWITLKYAHKAYFVFQVQQGNAATILVSLLQAQDVSGTGSKAGPTVPIWWNLDTSVNDTLVIQTFASTFTTDAPTKNKNLVFEVDPAYLDQANGFKTVTISTGASNAANVTACMAYVIMDRYAQATPPSVVIN